MLELHSPKRVKFICAFIYHDQKIYDKVLSLLKKNYGAIDFESEEISFDHTDYYKKEMGAGLKRKFVSFKRLKTADSFIDVKLRTVKLERKFAKDGKRSINIDPGYLTLANLVLLTTKNFSHRIYLGRKVFAEVTLLYQDKKFVDLPWTFPDYKTDAYKDVLTKVRTIYYKQVDI